MAKSYIICLYTTLLLVGLAACVAVQPSGRLLGGLVPQMSPCWLDICPGRTQAREAWAHLRNQIIPLGGEIQDNGDSLYSSIATADDAASTWAFVHDGVVYTIAFEGPQVSLGQVVDRYGRPDSIAAVFHQVDTKRLRILLYYPTKGVIASYFEGRWEGDDGKFEVLPELPVDQLIIFNSSDFEQSPELQTMILTRGNGYDAYPESQQWHGFGSYDVTELDR